MQQICEIVTSQQLGKATYAIAIKAEKMAKEAQPGQFIHILCGDSVMLRRPISICDASDGIIRLVFEVKGEGTRWLSRKKSGALDIIGPLGQGYDLGRGSVLLVGGGIGVPPLLYAARASLGTATAILGFKSKGQILLERQFKELCKKVYVTTDDGSYGEEGFVSSPLARLLGAGEYDTVLACGPPAMLRSVAALCAEFGVRCQVSLEERMGCGVGACLVCACKIKDTSGAGKYAHVCKDGPVFEASEVIWDD